MTADHILIERYLDGECSLAEINEVERRLISDREFALELLLRKETNAAILEFKMTDYRKSIPMLFS